MLAMLFDSAAWLCWFTTLAPLSDYAFWLYWMAGYAG
jgi:hypothetical protein